MLSIFYFSWKSFLMFLKHEIDPKEIDEQLKRLINEGKIQTDYLKQIKDGQNKASEYLKIVHLKFMIWSWLGI